jgi:predicted nucleotidyltransferase component of viral defense system
MSVNIIQQRLADYKCASQQEEENALREITQEVTLAALSRSGFFKAAAFQGGTCLRVFYGLERFSEDLDFVLRSPDLKFPLAEYVKGLSGELEAYGYRLEVIDRSRADNAVKKCFLKDESLGRVLTLTHLRGMTNMRKIRIKIEVDANPPAKSGFETKYLDFPFPFAVTVQDQPSLFAGKSHALLCRTYTKGRDWYDFLWYVSRGTAMNWDLLNSALSQQGPWAGQGIKADADWYLRNLENKIQATDWQGAKEELLRFLKPSVHHGLEIWGRDFFLDRLEKLGKDLREKGKLGTDPIFP